MTNDRSRMPMAMRTTGRALAFQDASATPLLDHWPAEEVHPDFAARAAIWKDQRNGLLSLAEAQRRSALVGQLKAEPAHRRNAPPRPRHTRPAPQDSRQYANAMATTAARDDRLTPNAKSFLQVLRARCGKGRTTEFAKATLAAVMSRSARTIRRYLVDLERFGYITTEIRRTGRGLHTGLVVTITEKVAAFFEDVKGLAQWLAETPQAVDMHFIGRVLGNKGVTSLSLKNQIQKYRLLGGQKMAQRSPWGAKSAPS